MNERIESWISTLHAAHPEAEFVSLEPEDGEHALLAALWPVGQGIYSIGTFACQAFGRPELFMQVSGTEEQAADWALALLQFADDHRALADMVPGALFAGKNALVDSFQLDSWVLGLAVHVPGTDYPSLHVYPLYQNEIEVLQQVGLSKFLGRAGEAVFDPARRPIQKEPS